MDYHRFRGFHDPQAIENMAERVGIESAKECKRKHLQSTDGTLGDAGPW